MRAKSTASTTVPTMESVGRSFEKLLRDAVNGDAVAWDELVTALSPAVWSVARAYRLPRAEAEDLVQDVWMKLVSRHDTIREPDRLPGWIKTVATNLAKDREARRGRVEIRESFAERATEEAGPEEAAAQQSDNALLYRGFKQLDPRCQTLLGMCARGSSYDTIAAVFERPIGWVGPTRSRCLAKLRKLLEGSDLQ